MVSPPDKHGAPIEALTREGGLILACEDGDSLTYVADGAIGEEAQGNRSPEMQQVLATRDARRLELTRHRHAEGQGAGRRPGRRARVSVLHARPVARAGGTGGVVGAEPPLAPEVTQKTMYLRDDATGSVPAARDRRRTSRRRRNSADRSTSSAPRPTSPCGARLASRAERRRRPAPGLYEWSEGALHS